MSAIPESNRFEEGRKTNADGPTDNLSCPEDDRFSSLPEILRGAAYISSGGRVYRLFTENDEATIRNASLDSPLQLDPIEFGDTLDDHEEFWAPVGSEPVGPEKSAPVSAEPTSSESEAELSLKSAIESMEAELEFIARQPGPALPPTKQESATSISSVVSHSMTEIVRRKKAVEGVFATQDRSGDVFARKSCHHGDAVKAAESKFHVVVPEKCPVPLRPANNGKPALKLFEILQDGTAPPDSNVSSPSLSLEDVPVTENEAVVLKLLESPVERKPAVSIVIGKEAAQHVESQETIEIVRIETEESASIRTAGIRETVVKKVLEEVAEVEPPTEPPAEPPAEPPIDESPRISINMIRIELRNRKRPERPFTPRSSGIERRLCDKKEEPVFEVPEAPGEPDTFENDVPEVIPETVHEPVRVEMTLEIGLAETAKEETAIEKSIVGEAILADEIAVEITDVRSIVEETAIEEKKHETSSTVFLQEEIVETVREETRCVEIFEEQEIVTPGDSADREASILFPVLDRQPFETEDGIVEQCEEYRDFTPGPVWRLHWKPVWPKHLASLELCASNQIRYLADHLEVQLSEGRKIISFNGFRSGDGCTTLSLCAARELAERGYRLLLADAHRQHPELALLLELDIDPHHYEIMTLIPERLELLPWSESFIEIDAHDRPKSFPEIVASLRDDYDAILLDGGSLVASSFADRVAQWRQMQSDGVLLVVNTKNPERVNIRAVASRLHGCGIELLGVAENYV